MKFSAIILSLGFAALVAAQARNSTAPSAPTPTQTTSFSPQVAACLGACKEDDVTCRAKCLGSAAPNEAAVNATNTCIDKCPKGDGSEAANDQYSKCVTGCINTIYLSTATPAPTGGSGSGSGSGGNSANPTSGGGPSGTSSGSSSTSSPNAGSSVKVVGSFLTIFGIAAGVLAL